MKYKYAYIRTPRTGSTSIKDFCESNNILSLEQHKIGFWCGNIPWVLKELKKNGMFIFASVRNPYDRAVSIYRHWSWRRGAKYKLTFKDFCFALSNKMYPTKQAQWHSVSFAEYMFYKNQPLFDYAIRFEQINKGIWDISNMIGVPYKELKHLNKPTNDPFSRDRAVKLNKPSYVQYYTNETIAMIKKAYAQDIEYFNYEFGE